MAEQQQEQGVDMLKGTIKAVKGSRDKWLGIATGNKEDKGIYDCPLCARFSDCGCVRLNGVGEILEKCPLELQKEGCTENPSYQRFQKLARSGKATTKAAKRSAACFAKSIEAVLE